MSELPTHQTDDESQISEDNDTEQEEKVREWTPEELNFLFKTFAEIDANDDGSIVLEELGTLLRNLGQNPTDEELRQIMAEADNDDNQRLDFDEFCRLIDRQLKDQETIREELRKAFMVFDKDNNGTICFAELKAMLKSNGSHMSDEEISDLIGQVDVDGDGCVNFEEFVDLIMGNWLPQKESQPKCTADNDMPEAE